MLPAHAQPRSGQDLTGQPIEAGLVLIDGRTLERPYVVTIDDAGVVSVNGQAVGDERLLTLSRRASGGKEGRRGDRSARGRRSGSAFLARGLERGSVFFVDTDLGLAIIPRMSLPAFVEILDSDESRADKLIRLGDISNRPAAEGVWSAVLDRGQPDELLLAEAEVVQAELDAMQARLASSEAEADYSALLPLLAIGAVLAAIGVLIHTLRSSWSLPVDHRGWRHIDPTGKRTRTVVALVSLLVVLNGLDLLFTILAERTGRFVELNPIGEQMMHSPLALGLFKAMLVVVGVGIILFLRRRRLAELTAWWLCALYMLVLVRWVAVNNSLIA